MSKASAGAVIVVLSGVVCFFMITIVRLAGISDKDALRVSLLLTFFYGAWGVLCGVIVNKIKKRGPRQVFRVNKSREIKPEDYNSWEEYEQEKYKRSHPDDEDDLRGYEYFDPEDRPKI